LKNERGFTLVELVLAAFLLSMLCAIVWGLFSHYVLYYRKADDRADIYSSLRISLNRMCREIKYAQSVSAASDGSIITFVNAERIEVSYYCLNNQLLRREKGVAAPLSGNIESISFSYVTKDGLVIDKTNVTEEKLRPGWVDGLSLIDVGIKAGKPGLDQESVALTRTIYLRGAP